MTSQSKPPMEQGPKGPQLDELLDGLMGWNRSFLRTLSDGLLAPERVAHAVLIQERDTYASPLRLLIFLFGIYTALTVFIVGGDLQSIETVTPASAEVLDAWLVEQGTDLATVNAVWSFWLNILVWPIMVISSFPFALLFKAFAPKRTLYGAVLVYLTTINTMTAALIILMLGLVLVSDSQTTMMLSLFLSTVIYFYVTARVVSAHYSSSLIGTILKVFSFMLLTPVTLVITVALQFLAFDQVMEHRFDLNVRDMIELRGDTAP
ncbi:DUF3667 domain-containing protein [Oceanicaulis alexandrii]|uniref:DUF3667 domain-containing protein n=1 Tax=Oceanicaulis alexandrii TaxID=153233 RepID=UPI00041EA0D1|nr:DUF3667 domain-containing protein [Oceanicaulis alexandrii]